MNQAVIKTDFAALELRAMSVLNSEGSPSGPSLLTGRIVGQRNRIYPPVLPAYKAHRKTSTKRTGSYSPNKVGRLSSQIASVQLSRSIALSSALMVAIANRDVSSATLIRGQMLEARKIAESQIIASLQNMRRRSTEHGDFTACFRGGRY
jgi:hypothetical protein